MFYEISVLISNVVLLPDWYHCHGQDNKKSENQSWLDASGSDKEGKSRKSSWYSHWNQVLIACDSIHNCVKLLHVFRASFIYKSTPYKINNQLDQLVEHSFITMKSVINKLLLCPEFTQNTQNERFLQYYAVWLLCNIWMVTSDYVSDGCILTYLTCTHTIDDWTYLVNCMSLCW